MGTPEREEYFEEVVLNDYVGTQGPGLLSALESVARRALSEIGKVNLVQFFFFLSLALNARGGEFVLERFAGKHWVDCMAFSLLFTVAVLFVHCLLGSGTFKRSTPGYRDAVANGQKFLSILGVASLMGFGGGISLGSCAVLVLPLLYRDRSFKKALGVALALGLSMALLPYKDAFPTLVNAVFALGISAVVLGSFNLSSSMRPRTFAFFFRQALRAGVVVSLLYTTPIVFCISLVAMPLAGSLAKKLGDLVAGLLEDHRARRYREHSLFRIAVHASRILFVVFELALFLLLFGSIVKNAMAYHYIADSTFATASGELIAREHTPVFLYISSVFAETASYLRWVVLNSVLPFFTYPPLFVFHVVTQYFPFASEIARFFSSVAAAVAAVARSIPYFVSSVLAVWDALSSFFGAVWGVLAFFVNGAVAVFSFVDRFLGDSAIVRLPQEIASLSPEELADTSRLSETWQHVFALLSFVVGAYSVLIKHILFFRRSGTFFAPTRLAVGEGGRWLEGFSLKDRSYDDAFTCVPSLDLSLYTESFYKTYLNQFCRHGDMKNTLAYSTFYPQVLGVIKSERFLKRVHEYKMSGSFSASATRQKLSLGNVPHSKTKFTPLEENVINTCLSLFPEFVDKEYSILQESLGKYKEAEDALKTAKKHTCYRCWLREHLLGGLTNRHKAEHVGRIRTRELEILKGIEAEFNFNFCLLAGLFLDSLSGSVEGGVYETAIVIFNRLVARGVEGAAYKNVEDLFTVRSAILGKRLPFVLSVDAVAKYLGGERTWALWRDSGTPDFVEFLSSSWAQSSEIRKVFANPDEFGIVAVDGDSVVGEGIISTTLAFSSLSPKKNSSLSPHTPSAGVTIEDDSDLLILLTANGKILLTDRVSSKRIGGHVIRDVREALENEYAELTVKIFSSYPGLVKTFTLHPHPHPPHG